MNELRLDFSEVLFRHRPQEVDCLAGIATGTILYPKDECSYSPFRPAGKGKNGIKVSGAAKILDWILGTEDSPGNAVICLSSEGGVAYCEFMVREVKYHALISDGIIYLQEENAPFLWHKLLLILAARLLHKDRLSECFFLLNKSFDSDISTWDEEQKDLVLAFVDEFYYGETKSTYRMITGTSYVKEESESAFRSGLFDETYGNSSMLSFSEESKAMEKKMRRKTKMKTETEVFDEIFEKIKRGDYILDYEWDKEQEAFITPLSFLNGYVPDSNFFTVFRQVNKRIRMAEERIRKAEESGEKAIASKRDAVNIFLAGKPGTGKTYLLFALSAALGFPIRSIPMGKNTEEDTFEGMSKVIDGKLTEVRTPFLINGEKGGISIIEEINLASPDVVMGAIGQFVEFPYSIMEQGYQTVRRHPLNIIVGTMNIGTAGSKDVSEALSSRFPQTYVLEDPKREDFIARLQVEGYEKKDCEWVYDRYEEIIDALKSPDYNCEEFALNVTFRSCLGALQAMEDGCDAKTAIKNTMIGKVAEKDLDVAERLWNMIQDRPDYTPADVK